MAVNGREGNALNGITAGCSSRLDVAVVGLNSAIIAIDRCRVVHVSGGALKAKKHRGQLSNDDQASSSENDAQFETWTRGSHEWT